jgi:hypothetical protein
MMFDDDPEKSDFEFRLRERFLYEYDMYDSWEHDVRLEKILPCDRRIYPQCTGGHRLAPPEDCRGARFIRKKAIRVGGGGGRRCQGRSWR